MYTWVVLPTYNEAENLGRMVHALCALDLDLRILVVDDASPDGTGAMADELARELPAVRVIHREGERGLGSAYLAGFREAIRCGAEAVISMDCDFSHDPRAIPSLIQAAGDADVVIGSRYTGGGRIRNWPWHRKAISALANRFVHSLFRLPTRDCTSGFRLYRTEVLQQLPWYRVRSTGYSFLVELLFWATQQEDVRVSEVPICFTDRERGTSKMGWREAAYGSLNLLRLHRELSAGPAWDAQRPILER